MWRNKPDRAGSSATHPWPRGACRGALGRLIGLGLCVSVFAGLAGCQPSLFKADLPRSQYQRYEELRGHERQTTRADAFGRQKKDLRGRLAPLGTP